MTLSKGIGHFGDLTARYGIRMEDLANPITLKYRIKQLYGYHHIGIGKQDLDILVEKRIKIGNT